MVNQRQQVPNHVSDAWLPHPEVAHPLQVPRKVETENFRRKTDADDATDFRLHRLRLRDVDVGDVVRARAAAPPEVRLRLCPQLQRLRQTKPVQDVRVQHVRVQLEQGLQPAPALQPGPSRRVRDVLVRPVPGRVRRPAVVGEAPVEARRLADEEEERVVVVGWRFQVRVLDVHWVYRVLFIMSMEVLLCFKGY